MKKILKWGGIIIVVLLVIGAVSGAGSSKLEKTGSSDTTSSSSRSNQPTETFKIGDEVNLDGKTIVVNGVEPYTSSNQFMSPSAGKRFVAVDITLQNNSDEAYNYNVLEFNLQDNEDYSYTNALADIEPYLTTGAIQPGQRTRGYIPFEIPTENEPVKLTYTPNFWGTSQIIIELE